METGEKREIRTALSKCPKKVEECAWGPMELQRERPARSNSDLGVETGSLLLGRIYRFTVTLLLHPLMLHLFLLSCFFLSSAGKRTDAGGVRW